MSPEQAVALVEVPEAEIAGAVEHLRAHGSLRTRVWLDRSHPSQLSLAILDAAACRLQFSGKFSPSDGWLLTREAAEQATAGSIAAWRADYIKQRFSYCDQAVELGTGIGGDSVYLSRRFQLTGYEQQAARAILAAANLRRLGGDGARVLARRVEPADLEGDLLFVDPARRGQGGRSFDPEAWDPPLSSLLAPHRFRTVVIKTAPGLDLSVLPDGVEAHFLSLSGDLKEAMLVGGDVAAPSRLNAWLWPLNAAAPLYRQGDDRPVPVRAPAPGDYLLNPDPSLIRARGLGGLAEELEAGAVHPRIAYLCGPRPCGSPWATSFEIVDCWPLDWGRLNSALTGSGWSEFEYLGRGVPFEQAEVLTRLKKGRKRMRGQGRGSVIIYRDETGYQVCLARRCAAP